MRKVAIDANLLLLLVVGKASKSFIAEHKRLSAFTGADFDMLRSIVVRANSVLITPNVATEVSNLLGYGVREPMRSRIFAVFRELVPKMLEHYEASQLAIGQPEFDQLGLSDCAWLGALDPETVLLTADLPLYLAAIKAGFKAENVNHLWERQQMT